MSAAATYDMGVRSPDAPTDPSQGTTGVMPRFRNSASCLMRSIDTPEYPREKQRMRVSIAARRFRNADRITGAAAVEPDEVEAVFDGHFHGHAFIRMTFRSRCSRRRPGFLFSGLP